MEYRMEIGSRLGEEDLPDAMIAGLGTDMISSNLTGDQLSQDSDITLEVRHIYSQALHDQKYVCLVVIWSVSVNASKTVIPLCTRAAPKK